MKYKAVIFDLDGTLLDTLADLTDTTNATLREFGFPEHSQEEVKYFVGSGVETLLRRALPHPLPEAEFAIVFQRMRENYMKYQNQKTQMYSGMEEFLQELKKRGYQTAIVSNKMDQAVQALMPAYFKDLVSLGVGATDEKTKKPAPDMVFRAVQELGLSVSDCVYVGDSDIDVFTGKNAGMDVISVTWGFRTKEDLEKAGSTVFVNTPEEFWQYI